MLIHFHPATVHFPIAFLLLASIAGLLYLYWRPLALLRTLTWWPLRLGWLGAGVAILTGILAQSNLPPQAPYRAILNWHITTGLAVWVLYGFVLYRQWLYSKPTRRAPRRHRKPETTQQQAGRRPTAAGLGGTRFGGTGLEETGLEETGLDQELLHSPQARLWLTALFIVGAALVLASGWNGGRLVYVWGVNVAGQ
ncbi:MAG: hypothetical protein KDE19_15690 [Caldilineaceae bacterium]|nr:hypothetical protein [Caldilineaceae bacterium]